MMLGCYGYLLNKKEWYWKVEVQRIEVASGTCQNKEELMETIKLHPMVEWNSELDFAF